MSEKVRFESEEAWLAARRRCVTSTEVSALFGQNPRLTAFELYHRKRDPKLDTFEGTERTEWGHELQDAIGTFVHRRHAVECLPIHPWTLAINGVCAASGDFLITGCSARTSPLAAYFERLGEGILEIKNVDSLVYKNDWTQEEMPDHIEIQLQAEMHCWDTQWGAVAALVGGNRLEIYVRERDTEVCRLIEHKSRSFMHDFENGKEPPAVMPQDAGMVIALHQYAEPNKVYDGAQDDYLRHLCAEYRAASAVINKYTDERESLKATILARIKDAERVVNCGSYNISAAVRAPVEVQAYVRKGFRDLRITERKSSGGKDKVRG